MISKEETICGWLEFRFFWSMGDNFWLRNDFALIREERRFTVVGTCNFPLEGERMSEGAS
jgi:hypothetical protein